MRRGLVRIYFDGGCRPNPGAVEAAVVIRGVLHLFRDLWHGDNSDAEWLALRMAARLAADMGATDVEFVGDSRLIVGQASGMAKCRSDKLAAHLDEFRAAVVAIPTVRVRYVARSKNLAGIALAAGHPR